MAKAVKMPLIAFIVARSVPGLVIGCDNKLPWHLTSDLRRFRSLTTGHVIIMGNKTFDSIGRPLPNRTNVVLSRSHLPNQQISLDSNVLWAGGREAALYLADLVSIGSGAEKFFVIGGSEIYRTFFGDDIINQVYLTEVFADVKGDAVFDFRFPKEKWKMLDEKDFAASDEDEYPSRFIVYERRERRYRNRFLSSFFTDQMSKSDWVSSYLDSHKREIAEYEAEHQYELLEGDA